MNITHYDLFAGIGGFSLALEEVFNEAKINHIFCEWAEFPAAVLKKHWPNGIFYGDIADLVTDTNRQRYQDGIAKTETARRPLPVAEHVSSHTKRQTRLGHR